VESVEQKTVQPLKSIKASGDYQLILESPQSCMTVNVKFTSCSNTYFAGHYR